MSHPAHSTEQAMPTAKLLCREGVHSQASFSYFPIADIPLFFL